MRSLVIDAWLIGRAKAVLSHSSQNVLYPERDGYEPPGDDPRHRIETDSGFRVVYSHDHFREHGTVKRMSISVDASGKLPSPRAVNEFAQLFDFTHGQCQVATVPVHPGAKEHCVMVAEPLE